MQRPNEFYSSRRLIFISLIITSVLVIGMVVGVIFIKNKDNSRQVDTKNYFQFQVIDTQVIFTGSGISKILIRYGRFEEVNNDDEADYIINKSSGGSYFVKYNGEYTVTCKYKDDTTETKYFTIDSNIEPATLTFNGEKIEISANDGYEITNLYYCYGVHLGDYKANYIYADLTQKSYEPFGNGYHTFQIYAKSDDKIEVFYQAVLVSGSNSPIVRLLDIENKDGIYEAIGVYCYGFDDVNEIRYAHGDYDSFVEMLNSGEQLFVVGLNSSLNIRSFISGETYTFCFRATNKEYIVKIIIP